MGVLASRGLLAVVIAKALQHRDTVMIGRTHGVHAEPTTFGAKLATFLQQVSRLRDALVIAQIALSLGLVTGAALLLAALGGVGLGALLQRWPRRPRVRVPALLLVCLVAPLLPGQLPGHLGWTVAEDYLRTVLTEGGWLK